MTKEEPGPPEGESRVWHYVHLLGRALVASSALMVLFLVYQLWGTGIVTAREQRALKADFERRLEAKAGADELPSGRQDGSGDVRTKPGARATAAISQGDALALLELPAIDATYAVVEGVQVSDLREGPGHYPWTPLPGERGNSAIAGHRTTYGAPFGRLDELEPGDEIYVSTLWGRFTYRVTDTQIVGPREVDVLRSGDDNRLTLTTCNPKYSAAERLVVSALLVGEPIDAPAPPPSASEGNGSDAGIDGTARSSWGLAVESMPAPSAALAIVTGAWWWGWRRRRRWYTLLAGAAPFSVALFFFYAALEQVLPGSY